MILSKTIKKQPQNIFQLVKKRETTGTKLPSVIDLFEFNNEINSYILYKAFNIDNINIYNLQEYINNNNYIIYKIDYIHKYDKYVAINFDYSAYHAQRYRESTFTKDEELLTCDAIGTSLKTKSEDMLCDNVSLMDNLYTNSNATKFYLISDYTLEKFKKAKFKIEILDDKLDIPFFSSQTGGNNKKTYVKYGKYVRKVCIDKSKKYIKVNKEIIYLNDIKGKYKYVNK